MANPNPKPPKRKRRSAYTRNIRGGNSGSNKRSTYNYAAAREELGMPDANSQQLTSELLASGPNPRAPKGRSPLKREKEKTITNLEVGAERMEKKVSSPQQTIRDLSRALMDQKHKWRLTMAKLVEDAESMLANSICIDDRNQMDSKMSAAELAVKKERQRVIDERKYSSLLTSARKFNCNMYYVLLTFQLYL